MKRLILSFTCIALALGACGGGDSDSSESSVVAAPQPSGTLDQQLTALQRAIDRQDCRAYAQRLLFSFARPPQPGGAPIDPEAPVHRGECAPGGVGATDIDFLKGVKLTSSKEFGPAGIAEGKLATPIGGYDNVAALFLVDRDGSYRTPVYFVGAPQLEEAPSADAEPGQVVDRIVKAMRSGDCTGTGGDFVPAARFARSPATACEDLANGVFFAPAVKETPPGDLRVEELFTARDFSVFGVATKDAYFAIVLVTPELGPGQPPQPTFSVTDVVPLTDVDLPASPPQKKG
ncbi:MAG: hypothetical protein EXQ70_08035 [Solirubrobacterales bacterium]|nr:hypothetical protein [Solirubrobacterales bacterium]